MNIPILLYLIADAVFARPFPGWTGLMVTLCFFFGVVCSMLGVMTEYLHRICIEAAGRPLYFVAKRTTMMTAPAAVELPAVPAGR